MKENTGKTTYMQVCAVVIACVVSILPIRTLAADFANETLTYKVQYKWGLIQKVAGSATLNLRNNGDMYSARLTAASAPWADSFFKVRDTLECEIIKDGFKPTIYKKMAHEDDTRAFDVVKYLYDGNTVTGDCHRRQWKKGELRTDETRIIEAQGQTVDMLSSFYYMRSLPFDQWKPGTSKAINIFSGKRKELLTIKYTGRENVESEGKIYDCYHIKFKFTSEDGAKTSDDIDAWITTSPRRLPIKLEGKLVIGKIRCFYTGG